MVMSVRLAVLLSGTGRTLQNLVDRIADGSLDARIAAVVANPRSSKVDAVRNAGAPVLAIDRRNFESPEAYSEAITAFLVRHDIDLVIQAGLTHKYLFPERLRGRVLNIHPGLLPTYGGHGMYGHFVHEAVLAAGETESGCTVHITDEEYDHGPIVLEKRVPVLPGDTPETLAARVFEAECEAYPEAIRLVASRLGLAAAT